MTHETPELFPPADDTRRRLALGGGGILTDADLRALAAGARRVWDYMNDGEWHEAESIRRVAGGSEGLRRLREVRAALPDGWTVEKKRRGTSRQFWYRIARAGQ